MTHTCNAKGCSIETPPDKVFCRMHWLRLPREIRTRVTHAYVSGQHRDHTKVTTEWISAANEAIDWLEADDGRIAQLPPNVLLYADQLIAMADSMMSGKACCALVVLPIDGNGAIALRTLGTPGVLLPAMRWAEDALLRGDVQPQVRH